MLSAGPVNKGNRGEPPDVRGRFSVDVPGGLRVAWYLLRFGKAWREHCPTWVTDHERGERFALSDEESLLLDSLLENMHAVIDEARVPLMRSNKFWTPQRIAGAKDRVLAAIRDNRHGDATEWDSLRAMTSADWKTLLREITENPH
jgi:hypothetical protein